MKSWSILFLVLGSFSVFAQNDVDISFWSDVMINANNAKHRLLAVDMFEAEMTKIMENKDAFEFDFSSTPEITVLTDSLETFKLITWQLKRSEKDFDYYGYIIHKDGRAFKLNDAFKELEDIEYLSLNHEDWLGGIYYNLVQMGDKFFVFSYRQVDNYTKFKSFDVLSFAEDGSPILGEESFVFPSKEARDVVKSRVTFSYSADAILSLNYNEEMQMVVHDHLMPVMGQLEGQGPTKVPDGTYEGFKFMEGKWIYEEKLFNHTYDEAPRPNQILGKSSKDILGRDRKN